MAQFVLKIEKLSHVMGPRGSQDLRSPSPIMALVSEQTVCFSERIMSADKYPSIFWRQMEAIVAPQGFGPEAKPRGGTLAFPGCIYTRTKSIC